MAQYTITEEQIKDIAQGGGKKKIKEMFPNVFLKELEVGKWYKYKKGVFFIKSINGFWINVYGTNKDGEWMTDNAKTTYDSSFKPATNEEVEAALIAEAKRRGFVDGAKYKSPCGKFKRTVVYPLVLTKDGKDLKDSHCSMITYRGQWAEIIKEKILSKAEAEAKLTELSKDGFEYKIFDGLTEKSVIHNALDMSKFKLQNTTL